MANQQFTEEERAEILKMITGEKPAEEVFLEKVGVEPKPPEKVKKKVRYAPSYVKAYLGEDVSEQYAKSLVASKEIEEALSGIKKQEKEITPEAEYIIEKPTEQEREILEKEGISYGEQEGKIVLSGAMLKKLLKAQKKDILSTKEEIETIREDISEEVSRRAKLPPKRLKEELMREKEIEKALKRPEKVPEEIKEAIKEQLSKGYIVLDKPVDFEAIGKGEFKLTPELVSEISQKINVRAGQMAELLGGVQWGTFARVKRKVEQPELKVREEWVGKIKTPEGETITVFNVENIPETRRIRKEFGELTFEEIGEKPISKLAFPTLKPVATFGTAGQFIVSALEKKSLTEAYKEAQKFYGVQYKKFIIESGKEYYKLPERQKGMYAIKLAFESPAIQLGVTYAGARAIGGVTRTIGLPLLAETGLQKIPIIQKAGEFVLKHPQAIEKLFWAGYGTYKYLQTERKIARGVTKGVAVGEALFDITRMGAFTRGFARGMERGFPVRYETVRFGEAPPVWRGFYITKKGKVISALGRAEGKFQKGVPTVDLTRLQSEALIETSGFSPMKTSIYEKNFITNLGKEQQQLFGTIRTALGETYGVQSKFIGRDWQTIFKETKYIPADASDDLYRLFKKVTRGKKGFVFGSTTQKMQTGGQFTRELHDIDIFIERGDSAEVIKKALKILQKHAPKGWTYSVDPSRPTLINVKIKGQTHHAIDLHNLQNLPAYSWLETGEFTGLGFRKQDPIVLKGLRVTSLSEETVAKGWTITTAQKITPKLQKEFARAGIKVKIGEQVLLPPPHRVKDIGDFGWNVNTLIGSMNKDTTVAQESLKQFVKLTGTDLSKAGAIAGEPVTKFYRYIRPSAPPLPQPPAPSISLPSYTKSLPSYSLAPYYEPPSYKAPSYKATSYKTPSYTIPSYALPSYKPPSYKTPSYKPPSYKAPSYALPSYKPPSYKTPSYKPPSYYPPSYKPPIPTPIVAPPPVLLPFERPKVKRIKPTKIRKYTPSLIAVVERIQKVGVAPKPSKIFTGLEVRPIFVPEAPKKRRKRKKKKR